MRLLTVIQKTMPFMFLKTPDELKLMLEYFIGGLSFEMKVGG